MRNRRSVLNGAFFVMVSVSCANAVAVGAQLVMSPCEKTQASNLPFHAEVSRGIHSLAG